MREPGSVGAVVCTSGCPDAVFRLCMYVYRRVCVYVRVCAEESRKVLRVCLESRARAHLSLRED